MNADSSRKKNGRKGTPGLSPYKDSLGQEIGYKLDARYAGCLLFLFAGGLLGLAFVAFLAYWLTHE